MFYSGSYQTFKPVLDKLFNQGFIYCLIRIWVWVSVLYQLLASVLGGCLGVKFFSVGLFVSERPNHCHPYSFLCYLLYWTANLWPSLYRMQQGPMLSCQDMSIGKLINMLWSLSSNTRLVPAIHFHTAMFPRWQRLEKHRFRIFKTQMKMHIIIRNFLRPTDRYVKKSLLF
jgi:hypothetical protein